VRERGEINAKNYQARECGRQRIIKIIVIKNLCRPFHGLDYFVIELPRAHARGGEAGCLRRLRRLKHYQILMRFSTAETHLCLYRLIISRDNARQIQRRSFSTKR